MYGTSRPKSLQIFALAAEGVVYGPTRSSQRSVRPASFRLMPAGTMTLPSPTGLTLRPTLPLCDQSAEEYRGISRRMEEISENHEYR